MTPHAPFPSDQTDYLLSIWRNVSAMIKRNRKPTLPGVILSNHYMGPRGLTVSEFAKKLDVSRKHLSEIINGHKRVTPSIAVRLAHELDTTPAVWVNLQSAVDIWEAEKEYAAKHNAAA